MAVEESSSQDATLIDDDLVAALGFEPVTEVSTDHPADEPSADSTPVTENGSLDHSAVENGAVENGAVSSNGVHLDTVLDEAIDDDTSFDDQSVFDDDTVTVNSLDEVPSLIDVDDDGDLTAPVALVDLDDEVDDEIDGPLEGGVLDDVDDETAEPADAVIEADVTDAAVTDAVLTDAVVTDAAVTEPAVADEPDLEESDGAVSDADEFEADDVGDLIDLDQVDLTDAPALDDEIHVLADADSVFADADTPLADADTPLAEVDTALADPDSVFADSVFDVEADVTETVPQVQPSEEVAAAASAAVATPTKRYRRLRARKTRRVVRHIDPWSVLTFSVLFHMVVFAALLLSSVLVWNAAIASGMVENVESFIQELGDYETFEINADVMFRAAIVIAGMLTLASSVLVVLLTVVFNLISDLVGGIRVTVIEEETVRVPLDKSRGKETNE